MCDHVNIHFENADFCALNESFSSRFDVSIAMDNALPHMHSHHALESAIKSITNQNYIPNPHEHRHKTSLRTTTKHGSKLYPAIQV